MLFSFRCSNLLKRHFSDRLEYSAQYDIDIGKMRDYASSGECQVAQILKPGEADRFAIILSDPHARPSIGGWRFATIFRTNVGDLPGPEIEVWLPHFKGAPSFDELTSVFLRGARTQAFIMGNEFQKLASRPTDPNSPDKIAYSSFFEIAGGALAYPSTIGGYETIVAFGMTLAYYRGAWPLWERGGGKTVGIDYGRPEVEAAKDLYQTYGADAPEKAEIWSKMLAEHGDARAAEAAEKWKLVLEQVNLLMGKG